MKTFEIILTDGQEYLVEAKNEAAAYRKAYEFVRFSYGAKIKSVKEVT